MAIPRIMTAARLPICFGALAWSRPAIVTLPTQRRSESNVPAPAPPSDTDALSAEVPEQRRQAVDADRATSPFTPMPKRLQDGSEDSDVVPAALVSGAPMELQARTVRIYRETKPATQSGDWRGHRWRLDWDILSKGHRWENPLMGWQSSGDFMQGTHLNFQTKEDAIAFAEKQGYEYFVQEPNSRKFVPKAYANNFLYSPDKLKIIRTK